MLNLYELDCAVNHPSILNPSRCRIQLQDVVTHFIFSWQQITAIQFLGPKPGYNQERLVVTFDSAPVLINNPPNVSNVVLQSLRCSWSQISTLVQHFNIVNNRFPKVVDNDDVSIDLGFLAQFDIEGLKLLFWSPVEEDHPSSKIDGREQNETTEPVTRNDVTTPNREVNENFGNKSQVTVIDRPRAISNLPETTELSPLPAMETLSSLVVHRGNMEENDKGPPPVVMSHMFSENNTIPDVILSYLWPELQFLELEVSYIDISHILKLRTTAPKLRYLKLYVPFEDIPALLWTFDWDLLPWRTGFVVVYEPTLFCIENLKLDLRAKLNSHEIPPVHFYDSGSRYFICFRFVQLDLDVDFSQNYLDSLGYFQFTFGEDFNIKLNLSNNNLKSVDVMRRFQVIKNNVYPKRDCDIVAKVRMLDISHNQLNDSSGMTSDFCLLTHLNELYMHHNTFKALPMCSTYIGANVYHYVIRDLKELRTLDLSYNAIEDSEVNFDQLSYDEFSTIREISFRNNFLSKVPDFAYKARYVTHADFSENQITFKEMWPSNMKVKPQGLDHTTILLDYNNITNLDLSVINDLYNVLENCDLMLVGNPINCSCLTHRMYKYLISSSRSERPNLLPDNLPDFSFYENQWKCMYPSQWTEKSVMQIPEYEYDKMCLKSLQNCSTECFCYHSWNLGDVIVANCSHANKHVLTSFPEEVPDDTSHLILSGNSINSLCQTTSYLDKLRIMDLSRNSMHRICSVIVKHLTQVTELDLSGNQLRGLPTEINHMKNLNILDLSNNLLEQLPKTVENLQSLEHIDLSGNKFRCDCDTFWMTGWLIKSVGQVSNPRGIICFSSQGQGKRLIDLNQDDVGCYDTIKELTIGLGVAFPMTIILATVIYRYRGHIKIWLYTRFGFHPWDQVQENPEEKDYDAFVSFLPQGFQMGY